MTKSKKRYAVIIPTKDRLDFLKKALESVASQTIPPFQVCLVIDEEEDFKKYNFLKKIKKGNLESLEVYFTGGNAGGAKARNFGLDHVGEVDFVFFLDDDDEWFPQKVEAQTDELERRPSFAAVACWHYHVYEKTQEKILRKQKEQVLNQWIMRSNLTGTFSVYGIRWKGDLCKVRINEKLKSGQDLDFYMKVSAYGKTAVVKEPLATYQVHQSTRISGGGHKRSSMNEILRASSARLNSKDLYWWRAKQSLLSISSELSLWKGIVLIGKASYWIVKSYIGKGPYFRDLKPAAKLLIGSKFIAEK